MPLDKFEVRKPERIRRLRDAARALGYILLCLERGRAPSYADEGLAAMQLADAFGCDPWPDYEDAIREYRDECEAEHRAETGDRWRHENAAYIGGGRA